MSGSITSPEGLMVRPLWTTDEIGRTCERIERKVDNLDSKVDSQAEDIASLRSRMDVFEATRPNLTLKPIAAAGGSAVAGGGAIYAIIELLKHIWK